MYLNSVRFDVFLGCGFECLNFIEAHGFQVIVMSSFLLILWFSFLLSLQHYLHFVFRNCFFLRYKRLVCLLSFFVKDFAAPVSLFSPCWQLPSTGPAPGGQISSAAGWNTVVSDISETSPARGTLEKNFGVNLPFSPSLFSGPNVFSGDQEPPPPRAVGRT